MAWRTGDSVTVDFCTQTVAGVATDADSTPTGTLVINGTDNGATVTVTNKATGSYKAAVTLPTTAEGDVLQIRIAATVDSVAGKGIVWSGRTSYSLPYALDTAVGGVRDVHRINGQLTSAAAGITFPASIASASALSDVDTDVQTILTNLATVDGIVDDILVDTSTTLQGELDGIQADTEDIQSRLPAALTAQGNIKADALRWNGLATVALPLTPTIAGRTLDCSTGGEAGVDWGNVGNKTTANALDNTSISSVGIVSLSIGLDAISADSVSAAAVTKIQNGLATASAVSDVDTDIQTILTNLAIVDGNVDDIETIVGSTGVPLTAAAIDAIHDEPITEPSAMFAWASCTHRKIMQVLGANMRNKVLSDSDSVNVRNDADDADLWAYPSSDDGSIFTSGEAV